MRGSKIHKREIGDSHFVERSIQHPLAFFGCVILQSISFTTPGKVVVFNLKSGAITFAKMPFSKKIEYFAKTSYRDVNVKSTPHCVPKTSISALAFKLLISSLKGEGGVTRSSANAYGGLSGHSPRRAMDIVSCMRYAWFVFLLKMNFCYNAL